MRNFFLLALFAIGSYACLTCPVETYTTTPENFNASVPTSITVESNYDVNLIINYVEDIDQISIVLREGVNNMDECSSLVRPSLYFNSNGGSILLNVFGLEATPDSAHSHEEDEEEEHEERAMEIPASPSISSATRLSSIFVNLVGIGAFCLLLQKQQRASLLVLAVVVMLLPYSLSHSECGKGRLTMQINVPASANIKFIKVHSEGQSVCMDPSGNNCGSDSTMNPCSSIYCTNGGTCDKNTAECVCPPGYSGAACEQESSRKKFIAQQQNATWSDSKGNYSLFTEFTQCDQSNFTVRFESSEPLEYVTLMYQFSSKCDTRNCDCSSPINAVAINETRKVFEATIRGTGKPERALNVYALYKAASWNTRMQYPVDALPHQFVSMPMDCEGAEGGPCNPETCWVALGQHGCSA